jgi:hypothetical protein
MACLISIILAVCRTLVSVKSLKQPLFLLFDLLLYLLKLILVRYPCSNNDILFFSQLLVMKPFVNIDWYRVSVAWI